MNVNVLTNNDWSWLDAMVIDVLMRRGYEVTIVYGTFTVRWHVDVPEWICYLRAVQHVYAALSRGSERCWPLHCKRQVVVRIDEREYNVRYWVQDGGLAYGSVSD